MSAAGGLLAGALKLSSREFAGLLIGAAVLGGGTTLFSSLPDDRFLGFVIDAEVAECAPPQARLEEARSYWENALAAYPSNRQREGWREDLPAMVTRNPGAVVTLTVHQRWDVREHRKPWNRGELFVRDRGARGSERYFARLDGGADVCAGFVAGARARYAPEWEYASASPPDALPTFLSLHVLKSVPERFQAVLR